MILKPQKEAFCFRAVAANYVTTVNFNDQDLFYGIATVPEMSEKKGKEEENY